MPSWCCRECAGLRRRGVVDRALIFCSGGWDSGEGRVGGVCWGVGQDSRGTGLRSSRTCTSDECSSAAPLWCLVLRGVRLAKHLTLSLKRRCCTVNGPVQYLTGRPIFRVPDATAAPEVETVVPTIAPHTPHPASCTKRVQGRV